MHRRGSFYFPCCLRQKAPPLSQTLEQAIGGNAKYSISSYDYLLLAVLFTTTNATTTTITTTIAGDYTTLTIVDYSTSKKRSK